MPDTPARLAAGPELDALVAQVLFNRATLQSPCSMIWGYADGIAPDTISTEQVPPYSADTPEGWAAMHSLIARLKELGLNTVWLSLESDGTWEIELLPKENATDRLHGVIHGGQSAPEALARAALSAVEMVRTRQTGGEGGVGG